MKFCFALFTVCCLISFVKTQDMIEPSRTLSIQGQLQILDTIYNNAHVIGTTMDIKSCFCGGSCQSELNQKGGELWYINDYIDYIQCSNSEHTALANYFKGYPSITKPSSIIPYKISDFHPATINSSFLAYAMCGTKLGGVPAVVPCMQPPIINSTGITRNQMATLLNDFGTLLHPPNTYCTDSVKTATFATVLSQYPQPIQNLFNTKINAACKKNKMNDTNSMLGFYFNVLCPQTGCTYPIR